MPYANGTSTLTTIDNIDPDIDDVPAGVRGSRKLQRWVDLLAALLGRTMPVTFEELARDVPEYRAKLRGFSDEAEGERAFQSLKRAFERDKAELRLLGVHIESIEDTDGNSGGAYRLQRKNFYLPYLALTTPHERHTPKRTPGYGYQSLPTLAFDADELEAVVDAALMLRELGDPLLEAHADSALRKLAYDLPVGAVDTTRNDTHVLQSRAQIAADVFETLSDALRRRKRVTFTYQTFSTGTTEQREVEPYGVFFLHGHWYLAARDLARTELRNFRLSRISGAKVNTRGAQSADYDIPANFSLREHAASRHAWELGEDTPVEVTVRFLGSSGPAEAGRNLGRAAGGGDDRVRVFPVRRMDTFLRWLLSFAGEAAPVAPANVVEQYNELVAAVRAMYERPAPDLPLTKRQQRPALPAARASWCVNDAAAQFQRLLHVIPRIADGESHRIDELALATGTDAETLLKDLYSLVMRFDVPGGFVEGVQVHVEADTVSATTNHLKRPMRLTVPELRALELGLSVLRNQRAPNEHAVLERAVSRIRALLPTLPAEDLEMQLGEARLATVDQWELITPIRKAHAERRALRIRYRKSGADVDDERVVHPYGIIAANGTLYVIAHCVRESGLRLFRLDRMWAAEVLSSSFDVPSEFSVDSVLAEHKAMLAGEHETMTVLYSARISPWIAEREGFAVVPGEPLVVEHPLADEDWAVRHVLQYGTEAEVVGPAVVRERVRKSVPDSAQAPLPV